MPLQEGGRDLMQESLRDWNGKWKPLFHSLKIWEKNGKDVFRVFIILLGLTPIKMLSGMRKKNLDSDCSKQRRSVLFHVTGSPRQSRLQSLLTQLLHSVFKDLCSHHRSSLSPLMLASSSCMQWGGLSSSGHYIQAWQSTEEGGNSFFLSLTLRRLKSFSRSAQISPSCFFGWNLVP